MMNSHGNAKQSITVCRPEDRFWQQKDEAFSITPLVLDQLTPHTHHSSTQTRGPEEHLSLGNPERIGIFCFLEDQSGHLV